MRRSRAPRAEIRSARGQLHGAHTRHGDPAGGLAHQQNLQVELEVGAALVTAETIAPGRRAYGERFAYDVLELNVEVCRDGRELCADRLRFEPLRAPIDRPGLFGGADYLVSLLALAPESDVDGLAAKIDAALVGEHGAAAVLPNRAGVIARVLAEDAVGAERALLTLGAPRAPHCLAFRFLDDASDRARHRPSGPC